MKLHLPNRPLFPFIRSSIFPSQTFSRQSNEHSNDHPKL